MDNKNNFIVIIPCCFLVPHLTPVLGYPGAHYEALEIKRLLLVSTDSTGLELPLLKDEHTAADLHVSITYRIRRPNDHYKASNRLADVVKVDKLNARVTGGDLDNLVKYTLDCMNKVVYDDDKMITSLASKKIWCDDPTSDGSTTVEVKKIVIF